MDTWNSRNPGCFGFINIFTEQQFNLGNHLGIPVFVKDNEFSEESDSVISSFKTEKQSSETHRESPQHDHTLITGK